MTCKRTYFHAPSVSALIVAVLTVLVALTTPGTLASTPPLFLPAVSYSTGGLEAGFVTVADVNGDDKPDLIVANTYYSNTIGVLLGNGDGTFQPVVTYDSGGGYPTSIGVVDVNGDGKLDVLVGGCGLSDCFAANGVVSVLLGNGNGTFQPATTYRSGGRLADGIAISDLDGDGRLDIAVANVIDSSVSVFLGNGNGTFQLPVTFSSGATLTYSVAVADVNGDRKPDLLVSSNYGLVSDSCFGGLCGVVGVLLNNTTPPDTTPPVITLSATPKGLWPQNGLMRPVTISGTITDTGSGVNASTATYVVTDEYGEIQPTGAITLDPGGSYSFTVLLQASRRGSDFDGRRYMIAVRAKDNAGNGASKTSVVIVPHDQGH